MRRRATLPHPLECSTIAAPGLSYRVRNGTGRLTWAMTAAKPEQSEPPHGRPRHYHPNRPRKGPWRPGNRTGDANNKRLPKRSVTNNTMRIAVANQTIAGPHAHTPTKGTWEVGSSSPVSTGRLHPSRGFHLRPIEHVFNMRATGPRRAQGILISEQASRLDAFSGYPSRT